MPKTPERCKEIRTEMRHKILHESMLYFAKNGFSGTKISELAKNIGIGQGTMYVYFKSKEDLFNEIFVMINNDTEINELKKLSNIPFDAKTKIQILTKSVLDKLENDIDYASKVALNTQMIFEKNNYVSVDTTYQWDLYKYTAQIIEQGQREGHIVSGSPLKLADYFWGVVYLYALKKLFTTQYEMITNNDLERILLKDTI